MNCSLSIDFSQLKLSKTIVQVHPLSAKISHLTLQIVQFISHNLLQYQLTLRIILTDVMFFAEMDTSAVLCVFWVFPPESSVS
jgi:hypothetical protein